jgi:hypothetical protein
MGPGWTALQRRFSRPVGFGQAAEISGRVQGDGRLHASKAYFRRRPDSFPQMSSHSKQWCATCSLIIEATAHTGRAHPHRSGATATMALSTAGRDCRRRDGARGVRRRHRLWGHTVSNRFASIALSYSNAPASPSDGDRLNYFITFAVIGNALQPDRRRGAVSRHRPRECRRGPRPGEAYKGRVSGTNTTAAPQHQGAISRHIRRPRRRFAGSPVNALPKPVAYWKQPI